MKQLSEKKFIVDILFVLALFGVFAFSSMMLVGVGADVYQHTVADMDANSDSRILSSYLAGKLRQNDVLIDGESAVFVGELQGTPALVLVREINGELYHTYLYCHENYLKELFVRRDASLGGNSLLAGQKIAEVKEFTVEQTKDDLLLIRITTAAGEENKIFLSSRCLP